MRAVVMPRFGGPELFEERDVERPEPRPGEALVGVVVAGTNSVDAKLRADGSFAGLEPPVVLGSDVSGVVEEVGAGVADLARGTRCTTRRRPSASAPTADDTPSTTSSGLRSSRRSLSPSPTRRPRPCRSQAGPPTKSS